MPVAAPVTATPAAIPPTPAIPPASTISPPASITTLVLLLHVLNAPLDANFNGRHIDHEPNTDDDPERDSKCYVQSEIASPVPRIARKLMTLRLKENMQLPSKTDRHRPWVWDAEAHLKVFHADFDDDAENPNPQHLAEFKLQTDDETSSETKTEGQANHHPHVFCLTNLPNIWRHEAHGGVACGASTSLRNCCSRGLSFLVLGNIWALPAPMRFAIGPAVGERLFV
jgi:hypothetical protein